MLVSQISCVDSPIFWVENDTSSLLHIPLSGPQFCPCQWTGTEPDSMEKREVIVPMSLPKGQQVTGLSSYLPGVIVAVLNDPLYHFFFLFIPFFSSLNLSQVLSVLLFSTLEPQEKCFFFLPVNQYNNLS